MCDRSRRCLRNPSYTALRKEVLQRCDIQAIASLPKFAFAPYTKEKTYALFFTKRSDQITGVQKQPIWAYIIDYDGLANSDKRFPTKLRNNRNGWIHDELSGWVSTAGEEMASSPWWKSHRSRCGRRGSRCKATRRRPYSSIVEEGQHSRWACAARNPKGARGLRPLAVFLVVYNDQALISSSCLASEPRSLARDRARLPPRTASVLEERWLKYDDGSTNGTEIVDDKGVKRRLRKGDFSLWTQYSRISF